jgi:hypothetical protein
MCGRIATIIHCPEHDRRCWSRARALRPRLGEGSYARSRPTYAALLSLEEPKTGGVNGACLACICQGRSRSYPRSFGLRDAGQHARSTPKRSSTPQCHARRYCANHRATQNIEEHGRKHCPFPFPRRCERSTAPTLSRMLGPLQSALVEGRQRDNTPP